MDEAKRILRYSLSGIALKKLSIYIITTAIVCSCGAVLDPETENFSDGTPEVIQNLTERDPANDFEGIVLYRMMYESKSSQISTQDLETQFGTEVTTYFKNGFYKEITDSKYMSYQLFRHGDTAIYFKHQMEDDTLWLSYISENVGGKFELEIIENVDTILNYQCNLLRIRDNYGTKEYYYSKALSTDPQFYKAFKESNKDLIVSIMESIYLRLKMEYNDFTVDIIASNIERKNLDRNTFDLPKHKVLKKVIF